MICSERVVMIGSFPPSEKMAQKTFRPMLTYSDEAHHAVAPVLKRMIQHFTPQFLIGLTATD